MWVTYFFIYLLYIYIYAFSRRFYPKRLTVHSGYTFFCQYVCSLGIVPTTFCAVNAMLYHWATGTLYDIHLLHLEMTPRCCQLHDDYFQKAFPFLDWFYCWGLWETVLSRSSGLHQHTSWRISERVYQLNIGRYGTKCHWDFLAADLVCSQNIEHLRRGIIIALHIWRLSSVSADLPNQLSVIFYVTCVWSGTWRSETFHLIHTRFTNCMSEHFQACPHPKTRVQFLNQACGSH